MNCGLLMRRQWSLLKGFLEPRTSWKSSISGLVSEPYIALWACLPDSYCTLLYTLTYVHAMFSVSHTHTHTTVLRPFSGTIQVSRCQKRTSGLHGAREDHGGRHTDHLAGHHSIRTNQCPPPPSPVFYRPGALPAAQPVSKHFIKHKFVWI